MIGEACAALRPHLFWRLPSIHGRCQKICGETLALRQRVLFVDGGDDFTE